MRSESLMSPSFVSSSKTAVDVAGLTVAYGERTVLDKVTFALPEGAFLGVFGANGAGKTTLVRCLSTLERPTTGTVRLFDAAKDTDPRLIRRRIGYLSHETMLYRNLSLEENLMFYAELYGMPDARERARRLADAVGLKARRLDPVGSFSQGMARRAAIARAFISDPDLVLMDEPLSGLDVEAAAAAEELIAGFRDGRTFVMVSHDIARTVPSCTHVLVLDRGAAVLFENVENDADARSALAETIRSLVGSEAGR